LETVGTTGVDGSVGLVVGDWRARVTAGVGFGLSLWCSRGCPVERVANAPEIGESVEPGSHAVSRMPAARMRTNADMLRVTKKRSDRDGP
jgi:hypothetical protein